MNQIVRNIANFVMTKEMYSFSYVSYIHHRNLRPHFFLFIYISGRRLSYDALDATKLGVCLEYRRRQKARAVRAE